MENVLITTTETTEERISLINEYGNEVGHLLVAIERHGPHKNIWSATITKSESTDAGCTLPVGELDWIDYANVGKLKYWETNGQTYEEWLNTPQNKAGLRRMTLD
jgi:hypothetical protein